MDFVGRHEIKINRALRLAEVGRYPASASAMMDAVPASARANLTSQELAELLDAMWGVAERSKAIAAREVIDNGRIWDAREQCHRALA